MLSEQGIIKVLNKSMGIKTHSALFDTIKTDDQAMNMTAVCKHCGTTLSAFWRDEDDRTGWSAWKSDGNCK